MTKKSTMSVIERCEPRRFLAAQTLTMTGASENVVMWRDSAGYNRFGPSFGTTYYFDASGANPGSSGPVYRFNSSYDLFTINFGEGNDTFTIDSSVQQGSIRFDLRGEGSQDELGGGQNNDTISGGASIDSLVGGGGNDYIAGGDQGDFIDGSAGNDTIYGGSGGDTIMGGKNNDSLFGEGGSDSIVGNVGDDYISGGNDQDTLYGGDGNDTLYGDSGTDYLWGELGLDLLVSNGDGYVDFLYFDSTEPTDSFVADGGDVAVVY